MRSWAVPVLVVVAVLAIAVGVYAFSTGPYAVREKSDAPAEQAHQESSGGKDQNAEAQEGQSVPGLGTYDAAPAEGGQKAYQSARLGVSFDYPANYLLFEKEGTEFENQEYYVLTLQEDSEMIRDALAGTVATATEWPPAIHFSFYHEPSAPDTASALRQWVEAHPQQSSYFPHMPGGTPLAPVLVGGMPGISYDSPGLYWTHVVAFSYGEWVVIASVDSFEPEGDPRADDFAAILKTIHTANDTTI